MTMDFEPFGPDAPLYAVKANLFKALAHPVRIRILEVLVVADDEGATLGDLVDETTFEESALAQQLSVLRRHGAVTARRSGEEVRYEVAHPRIGELLAVARAFLQDTTGRATAAPSRPRLRSVPDSR